MNAQRTLRGGKPQLTLLSPLMPYPPHAGGTAHLMEAIRQLSRFYRVHFDTLVDDPTAVNWGPLTTSCQEVRAWERGAVRRLALSPPAAQQAWSTELATELQQLWAAQPPDIVQLEWTDMAQYAPLARRTGALVVCTAYTLATLSQVRACQAGNKSAHPYATLAWCLEPLDV